MSLVNSCVFMCCFHCCLFSWLDNLMKEINTTKHTYGEKVDPFQEKKLPLRQSFPPVLSTLPVYMNKEHLQQDRNNLAVQSNTEFERELFYL
jgi:hypothetical protein